MAGVVGAEVGGTVMGGSFPRHGGGDDHVINALSTPQPQSQVTPASGHPPDAGRRSNCLHIDVGAGVADLILDMGPDLLDCSQRPALAGTVCEKSRQLSAMLALAADAARPGPIPGRLQCLRDACLEVRDCDRMQGIDGRTAPAPCLDESLCRGNQNAVETEVARPCENVAARLASKSGIDAVDHSGEIDDKGCIGLRPSRSAPPILRCASRIGRELGDERLHRTGPVDLVKDLGELSSDRHVASPPSPD